MSQMTVSEMSLTETTDSPQHRQHWLAEQALNWSGLPVVHVRPTVFLQHFFFLPWAAGSIARDGTIRLPFGSGRTSPIDTLDIAEVVAAILASPAAHVGKVYELTGPKSQDMRGWRRSIPRRWAGRSPTWTCRWSSGATRSCVRAACRSTSMSTF